MWTLPLTAMVGVSGGGMFAYSSGVFMQSITGEFGWTRAQYSAVFVILTLQGLVTGPLVGRLIDRFGPRRVVLAGIVPSVISYAALGLAGGQLWQWIAICVIMSVFHATISPTAWVAGVIPRFHASRGMALAVTLAGLGLSSFIWPPIAAMFMVALGWRVAFPAVALVYLVAALPLTFFFFHDPERSERQEASAQSALNNRRNYLKAMMSRSFVGLVLAGALFACAYYGLMVHFVPILTNSGIGLSAAAGIVALVGLASIVGRLLSGLLLDTLPTRAVAITAFLLPLVTVALLNGLPGSVPGAIAAVLALGLASGAELNTITYVAARRFGQEVFGSIYAMFMAIIALGASIGPLMAGILFDARGSYHLYLLVLAPIFLAAAVLIAWVPLVSPEDESAI
jgi:predicted MFS family arabinose efflux permease